MISNERILHRLRWPEKPVDVVLDTDTYNEVDDQFALAYMIASDDKLNVKGIYAAPFQNERAQTPALGMERSYREIENILNLCGRPELMQLARRGAARFLPDEKTPVDSEAAQDLIRLAMQRPDDSPLYVLAIAAITNVASALLMQPEIADKIVVVWLAERMNTQAANKLLKILEEPWDKTLFLLLSASPEQLLPTIVSRTQCVTVPSIDETSLTRYLTARKGVPEADAFRAARLSRGDLLEALRYLRHASENDELFDLFVKLMRLSYEDRHLELLEWAETVASMGREEQKRLIENSVRLLRDSYMLTAGMEPICYLFGREEQFCKKFAPYVNNRNIEPLVAEMERTMRQIAQNGNPRIVFPHFALTVSKLINRL